MRPDTVWQAVVDRANLPMAETASIELDPISLIQSFYPMEEALARTRGRNPDELHFLAKVTRTH